MYFTDFIIQELYSLINLNNLLNTTKYLEEYKKCFSYWKFNDFYSLKYYEDEEFHKYINQYIPNTNSQLYIKIRNKILKNVNILGNVHTLDIVYCKSIHYINGLGNVHTLDLERTHITDEGIKHLGKVHTLNLSGCNKITDEGVKYLGKVHTLNLSGCNKITDVGVKHLGKVHILNISHCDFITDEGVKFLGNCHTLNVCGLDITEKSIKYLSNCHTLHLGRCGKLPNGMYALFRCFGVNYYPECTTINDNDLKYISTCTTIHLRGCSNITNIGISHLGNIETLKIYDCKKLIIEGFVGTERCQPHNII